MRLNLTTELGHERTATSDGRRKPTQARLDYRYGGFAVSYAVRDPKISKVMDMYSGSVDSADRAIGAEYDAAIRL